MNISKTMGLILLCVLTISGLTIGVYEWQKIEEKKGFLITKPSDNVSAGIEISNEGRIEQLENKLITLQLRLEEIATDSKAGAARPSAQAATTAELASNFTSPSNFQPQRDSIQNNLISAGVDPSFAEQIVNKENQLALDRLNLRDKAMREGYYNSDQYREELSSLNKSDTSLREDIGEDYFDRFLFSSGQDNRVTVNSVMKGSAAESAGIKDGDTLLSYGGQRLFQWRELQGKTTKGERGELTDLTILRDGREISLNIPRGPLGVRLGQKIVDPGP